MAQTAIYPCPACGFLVFSEPPGSYEICHFCGWEDDAVQLANPTSAGGANSESLIEAQRRALVAHPLATTTANGYLRDRTWRPVSEEEAQAHRDQVQARGCWANHAADGVDGYYWRRRSSDPAG